MVRSSVATPEARVSLISILTPVLERWKLLLGVVVAAVALTVAVIVLAVPRRYEASTTLAAISSSRLPSAIGGLAALSGLATDNGFAATPDLLASLLESRRVLLDVASEPMAPGSSARVIDRVRGDEPATRLVDVERAMRGLVGVSVDRRTGLISLSVQHRDSAVARAVAARLVETAGLTFLRLAKAQAAAKREGQEARVERVADKLRQAELDMIRFLASNRAVAPYSPAHAESERLEREISVAQQAYQQAVAERETALAHELEQTPALVVVDPVPAELAPLSKFTAFYGLAVGVVVFFLLATLLAAREFVRQQQDRGDVEGGRFVAALGSIPLLRGVVGAREGPPARQRTGGSLVD